MLRQELGSYGYETTPHIMKAEEFGSSAVRTRIYLFGVYCGVPCDIEIGSAEDTSANAPVACTHMVTARQRGSCVPRPWEYPRPDAVAGCGSSQLHRIVSFRTHHMDHGDLLCLIC